MHDGMLIGGVPAEANQDSEYVALRDRPGLSQYRRQVEELWETFAPHAEDDFRAEIARQFRKRYWELHLGCALLKDGTTLHPKKVAGPDFDVTTRSGSELYIEATSVSSGQTADRVPPISSGNDVEARPVPTEKIILRVLRAVQNKIEQYDRNVAEGRVAPDRSFVIATNLGEIASATTNHIPPFVAAATLGSGNLAISIDTNDLGRAHLPFLKHRPSIDRLAGPPVSTEIFRTPEFARLSGLLVGSVNPFSIPLERGGFEFLHNPWASQGLPDGWLSKGIEYRLVSNQLVKTDHGEHPLGSKRHG